MQNELVKAKQHQEVNVQSELAQVGVVAVHEDQVHLETSATLQSAHSEAVVSKDAVPPFTEPTPNLVSYPAHKTIQELKELPLDSSNRWSGVFRILQGEKKERKGDLPNAA